MAGEDEHVRQKTRLPAWLTKRVSAGPQAAQLHQLLADLELSTVCSGAHCPNLSECYARGTATFLILGDRCTRSCRFCAIRSDQPEPLREDEPHAVAEACVRMQLGHVVITSVTRDDLADGGAEQFARTIRAVRSRLPSVVIEVLIPDFNGDLAAVDIVLSARPDILNHNVETAPRLYPRVRPQADFQRSLNLLAYAKQCSITQGAKPFSKSGLMVGLGETVEEVSQVMRDLRRVDCDILTIGQYLAPSPEHLPIERFVGPEEFAAWEIEAKAMGFSAVAAAPFVRSSYLAERLFMNRRPEPPFGPAHDEPLR